MAISGHAGIGLVIPDVSGRNQCLVNQKDISGGQKSNFRELERRF